MNAVDMLLQRHENLHIRNIPRLLDPLTHDQIRARQRNDVNSIAWLVWHMARGADVGNRLISGCSQVLDDGGWMEKMNVPLRIIGAGMSDEEVTALSQNIHVPALRAYLAAVAERTRDVMQSLKPDALDEEMDGEHIRKVLFDEGALGVHAEWVPERWAHHVKGTLLANLAVTHNYTHYGEAMAIRGLMGIRARPDDGEVRAVPDWKLEDLPV